ncbi:MAG: dihydroorotate dehydrogenase-like protein [Bacteroidales bacterium]|nr:dihydroorotate dehydrogenase-like protein [Bacteroidales bacterium]
MANLETTYLGIPLKNPVIVSSCGLSSSIEKIEKLAGAGAGAIVLKSIFEEQINMEAGSMLKNSDYPEAMDYIMAYSKSNALDQYLKLMEDAKQRVDIPIFASINCATAAEWISFARSMEDAGADGLELNIYYIPNSLTNGESIEDLYYDILRKVKEKVTIPVVLKLGQQFSNLPVFVNKLKAYGANGVVLFNRFYAPDINTDTLTFTTSEVFSSPGDIRFSLRWVGIISSLVQKLDICASTGIHNGTAAVKQILAGAQTVQVCSTLYKNGPDYLSTILKGISDWMKVHNYKTLADFRGKMSYRNIPDPSIFERAQFMKYFSNMV